MNRARILYDDLWRHYGPQGWWPGVSRFEIAVGAILTQNTTWKNVEKALESLRAEQWLTAPAIAALNSDELAETIRAAGYYRQKARRLQNFARFLCERYAGQLDGLCREPVDVARSLLLQLNGIGPETADSILLYACQRPSFVVDTYTARVLKRHGWIEAEAGYEELQSWFTSQLPEDVSMWNELHALLVRVGKEHCKSTPACDGCPLQHHLEGPPLEQ